MPLRDSVYAIADADYFDWPVLPEAPSGLHAQVTGADVKLSWLLPGPASGVMIEKRVGSGGKWVLLTSLKRPATDYNDKAESGDVLSYRVSALNSNGKFAYSNVVRVSR